MTTPSHLNLRDYLILLAFALAVLAPGIASIPPVDRDESRYAVATTQMLQSGDFVDIRFQDRPRYLQPAGIYWLQSAAVSTFSSPEAREIWAFRLPSVGAALAVVLLTSGIGASLFGRSAGLAAALLVAASFSLNFEARSAKTDAALLLAVVTAQLALLRIYLEPQGAKWRAAMFWIALSAGVMLKGPIILLVSGGCILGLLVWDRRYGWLRGLHPLWGAPLFLLIALPWYIAIGLVSDGEFFAHAVGNNLLGKVGSGQQSHAAPPGYHLAVFWLAFWPGSLLASLAIPFAWRNRRSPSVRFLIAWIVPTWLVFELVATKLPHYVLPTYPAIACLAAAALFAPHAPAPHWVGGLGILAATAWLLLSAVVAGLAPVLHWTMDRELSVAALSIAFVVFGLAAAHLWFLARREPRRAVPAGAAAGLLAWSNTFALTLPHLDGFWLSPKIVTAVRAAARCGEPLLISHPYHEPSLVFLHGPHATRLTNTPELAARQLAGDRDCGIALIGAPQRGAFLAEAAAAELSVRPVGVVLGRNYSDGAELTLELYVADTGRASR